MKRLILLPFLTIYLICGCSSPESKIQSSFDKLLIEELLHDPSGYELMKVEIVDTILYKNVFDYLDKIKVRGDSKLGLDLSLVNDVKLESERKKYENKMNKVSGYICKMTYRAKNGFGGVSITDDFIMVDVGQNYKVIAIDDKKYKVSSKIRLVPANTIIE